MMDARVRTIGAGTESFIYHCASRIAPYRLKTRIAICRDAVFVTRISTKDKISSRCSNRLNCPIRTYSSLQVHLAKCRALMMFPSGLPDEEGLASH
jgi:hypothetical protein